MAGEEDNTFLTGLNDAPPPVDVQNTNDTSVVQLDQMNSSGEPQDMSLDSMIMHVDQQMREFERDAQYLDAEKARVHLESLKSRRKNNRQRELEAIQQDHVRVFLEMVAQHQASFDKTWAKKIEEHKVRADDLIDQLKWKHDEQQRELYEQLRKKRMPKFSIELLNMRKKQVLLARNKEYVKAEKVKRKADILEAFEIDNIRRAAKEENQIRFKALLKKQHWDRQGLADKLRIEKSQLLEAKAQDFERLRKRLKNYEAMMQKTHVRQALQSERKLAVVSSSLNGGKERRPNTFDTARGATRKMGAKSYGNGDWDESKRVSVKELAGRGGDDSVDEFLRTQSVPQTAR
jgi:hypothetical protein